MDNNEIALECVRLAMQTVSPTVDKRVEAIVETSKVLYVHVIALAQSANEEIKTEDKPVSGTIRMPLKK